MNAYQEAVDGSLERLQAGRYYSGISVCEEDASELALLLDLLKVFCNMDDGAERPVQSLDYIGTAKKEVAK